MGTSGKFLALEGLGKTFQNEKESKTVLEGVDLELAFRDCLAIVGPSGCGKTTLLLAIAGLIAPTAGTITFRDGPLAAPERRIALVLQHYGLFPWKTVAANITLGARLQNIDVPEKRLRSVKKELDIEGLDHLYPAQLSGGQRQRVALARALLLSPLLLLLDEPFAAIDTVTRERLQNNLLDVFAQRRFSFIIVTHNIEEAVFLGKRIVVLDSNTRGVKAIVENPGMGGTQYRNDPVFFERTTELRGILEGLE
ncbi:MAG: Aliphatic sulfonates import ATP-binding protein SsuB [Syntrophorhabdus sp. PtaB.Bin047]|jgi:NitT/TauT family transport system ATP-binding protein|nr:MAG: Aliphatic sulfonates import ATP-binding protein SsuB [Syntrophorhabdus sp. PtaB.Bin047]